MENYVFEKFYKDLSDGYQIKVLYNKKVYCIFKVTKNAYTVKLISDNKKKLTKVVTLRTLMDMFSHMSEFEYII